MAEEMGRARILRTLGALLQGRFEGLPGTRSFSCQRLWLESDRPLALETDGEVARCMAAEFGIRKERLLLCP
jgi:diacylglycerol kinase family enzyme